LVAVVTVAGDGQPVMPCGRCRQILTEHGGADCLVNGDGTVRPMSELLPGAFTATDMVGRTDPSS
jgi:cytidine deaminase